MGALVLTNDQRGVGIQTAIGTLMNKGIPLDAVEAGTPYVVSLGLDKRGYLIGSGPKG